jgi:hypothetical protein
MAKRSILEYLPFFRKAREQDPETPTPAEEKALEGEGYTHWELMAGNIFGQGTLPHLYNAYVNMRFQQDRERIAEYRRMASYSEVSDVLETICDEATMKFYDGNVLSLKFKGDRFNPPDGKITPKMKKEKQRVMDEFEELFFHRLDVNTDVWEWFHQFLVDGRLYQEVIVNEKKQDAGIQGLKTLPAETMLVIWNNKTGKIDGFQQVVVPPVPQGDTSTSSMASHASAPAASAKPVPFDIDQVNFVYYKRDPNNTTSIIGYLEKAIKPYRQLKLIEDSIIIYRIVRAPERLVFTVDVGGMPTKRAMEFIRQLQRQFSKKMTYNVSESKIQEMPNVISALENFWLPRNSDGRGPSVDVLQGGENLGEIRDLEYFVRKLYRALKYPQNRAGEEARSQGGGQAFYQTATEITKEEIVFAKFIERMQNKFERAFLHLFMQHLNFRGLKKKFDLSVNDFEIEFKLPSNYKEMVDLGEEQKRAETYLMLSNNEEFPKEWLMKRYMGLTDEEIEQMKQSLETEREEGDKGEGFRFQDAEMKEPEPEKGPSPEVTPPQPPAEEPKETPPVTGAEPKEALYLTEDEDEDF